MPLYFFVFFQKTLDAIFFWCKDPADRYELHRKAMLIIQNGLKDAGIKIPVQQMDLHISGNRVK